MQTIENAPRLELESLSGLELGEWLDDRGKPNWEWIAGRPVQKLMGDNWHSFLQLQFGILLRAWDPLGKVGPEWRITPTFNEFETRSIVPDVVYLTRDRYLALPEAERRYPTVAPEIVIEILSFRQSMGEINVKRVVCLDWGVKLVLVVHPTQRTITAYDREHRHDGIVFADDQIFSTPLFPGLHWPLAEVFSVLD